MDTKIKQKWGKQTVWFSQNKNLGLLIIFWEGQEEQQADDVMVKNMLRDWQFVFVGFLTPSNCTANNVTVRWFVVTRTDGFFPGTLASLYI